MSQHQPNIESTPRVSWMATDQTGMNRLLDRTYIIIDNLGVEQHDVQSVVPPSEWLENDQTVLVGRKNLIHATFKVINAFIIRPQY